MSQKSRNPAAVGTASGAGTFAVAGSAAVTKHSTPGEREHHPITAAALLLPRRTRPDKRLIVGLRRNPAGGPRPWLMQLDLWPAFTIGHQQLVSRNRFSNVAWHALAVRIAERDHEQIAHVFDLPEPLVWRYLIEHLVASLTRGWA